MQTYLGEMGWETRTLEDVAHLAKSLILPAGQNLDTRLQVAYLNMYS